MAEPPPEDGAAETPPEAYTVERRCRPPRLPNPGDHGVFGAPAAARPASLPASPPPATREALGRPPPPALPPPPPPPLPPSPPPPPRLLASSDAHELRRRMSS